MWFKYTNNCNQYGSRSKWHFCFQSSTIIQKETIFHQFRTKFLWKGSVDLVQKMATTFFWNSNHQLLDRGLNVTGICLLATRAGEQDTWNEAVIGPGMVPQNFKQSPTYVSRPDIPPRNVVKTVHNSKPKNAQRPG